MALFELSKGRNEGDARKELSSALGRSSSDRIRQQEERFRPEFMNRARRVEASSPYLARDADQTRAAQLALLQQMEAQRGNSVAALQGAQARGEMTQQALAAGAMGAGRQALLGSQASGAGLAADVARARMQEQLAASNATGRVASLLRGQDIRSADQGARAQLQNQAINDELARFYASTGATLSDASREAALERFKMQKRLEGQMDSQDQENLDWALGYVGNLYGGLATG